MGNATRSTRDVRAILDNLMDPLVVLAAIRDDDGEIVDFGYVDANKAACTYHGLDYDTLIGHRLLELMPAHHEIGLLARYAHVVDSGEPLVLDDFVYPTDGRTQGGRRHFDVRAVAVGDDLLVTWRDVGDRVAAQRELENTQRQRDLAWMSMDSAAIGMVVSDAAGVLTYANPAMHALLGYPDGQLVGRTFLDLLHPAEHSRAVADRATMLKGGVTSFHTRTRYVTWPGGDLWADVWLSPVPPPDGDGAIGGMVVQVIDATTEVQATEALQRTVRRFRVLAENASDIVYQTDLDGRIEWIAPAVSDILGWDPELLVGTRATALVAPEDLALLAGSADGVVHGIREHGVLAQFLTVRGTRKWMSVSARPLVGVDDDISGAVVSLRDVTSEQAAYEELAKVQQRFRSAMEAAPQGMVITDDGGTVLDVNPAAARLLGLDQGEMLGARLANILEQQAGACQSVERHEHVRTTHEGKWWIDHASREIPPDDGGATLFVHQLIDETSDRMWQRELHHRATHDVLTGVANRGSLMEHLDAVILTQRASAEAGVPAVGLLFCDLDNLKDLNDSRGHVAGDAVLAAVATRLSRTLRRGDRVGRIGGDEFVVVLDGVESEEEVVAIGEKLRTRVALPIEWGSGDTASTTISIGATLVRPDDDAQDALDRADSALYRAKRAGRDRVVLA